MNQKVAPAEEHRQGTEPSRRFVVDLNTGLLKEYISEMDRRAEGCMCPLMLMWIIIIYLFFLHLQKLTVFLY